MCDCCKKEYQILEHVLHWGEVKKKEILIGRFRSGEMGSGKVDDGITQEKGEIQIIF